MLYFEKLNYYEGFYFIWKVWIGGGFLFIWMVSFGFGFFVLMKLFFDWGWKFKYLFKVGVDCFKVWIWFLLFGSILEGYKKFSVNLYGYFVSI